MDRETLEDALRFRWLVENGFAWRNCYIGDWKEGEWLYDFQNARKQLDNFIASVENVTR